MCKKWQSHDGSLIYSSRIFDGICIKLVVTDRDVFIFWSLDQAKTNHRFFALIAFCIKHMVTDRDLLDFSGHVTVPE